jgi:AhpD family alkylhydroperoxidase
MDLSGTLQSGTLDRQMQESVAVAVSDFNGCTYCLSVHSGLAEQEGLSEDERERAQQFESEDPKRTAALHFVLGVVEGRGHPPTRLSMEYVRQATPTSRSWR